MVDSQKNQQNTFFHYLKTWNQMLNPKVLIQKDAKSLTLLPRELSVEEEELTEHMVEFPHIFPPTLIWNSTLPKRVHQSKERTKNKLDWQRNKLLNKDLLLESDYETFLLKLTVQSTRPLYLEISHQQFWIILKSHSIIIKK